MAIIKTEKLIVTGEEFLIKYKCSSAGKFSVDIPVKLADLVFTRGQIHNLNNGSKSIKEIQEAVNSIVGSFVETDIKTSLVIGIIYQSCGEFCKRSTGEPFFQLVGLYPQHKFWHEYDETYGGSTLVFDFKILIKVEKNGTTSYYKAIKLALYESVKSDDICVGYFKADRPIHNNIINGIPAGMQIVPYSESVVKNCELIQEQIRRASEFLYDLVSAKDFANLITGDLKLLE